MYAEIHMKREIVIENNKIDSKYLNNFVDIVVLKFINFLKIKKACEI